MIGSRLSDKLIAIVQPEIDLSTVARALTLKQRARALRSPPAIVGLASFVEAQRSYHK